MATVQQLVGREALTMVRPAGSTAPSVYVFAGDPVPAGCDEEDLARLLEEGYLEYIEVAVDAEDSADGQPTTKAGILAAVGEDKALAQQYLDQEQAAEKPRPTLVKALQDIVDA